MLHVIAESAPQMTLAGKVILYLIFPLIVISIPTAIIAAFRSRKSAVARRVAIAVAAARAEEAVKAAAIATNTRLDRQDEALALILNVVNPPNAPSLSAVLAEIQKATEQTDKRFEDHLRVAAADKAAIELRLREVAL